MVRGAGLGRVVLRIAVPATPHTISGATEAFWLPCYLHQAREGSSWAFWGKSNEPGNTSHDGGDSSSSSTTEHTAGEFHAVHDALDRGKIGMGPSCSAPVLDGKNLPLGTALGHAAGEPGPVVASISRVIEAVHEGTGLPWWATLVLAGTGVRLALTPLGLQQARALETNLRLWTQAQSQASTASLKAAAYVDTGESKGSLSSVDGSGQRRPLFRDVWSRFQHLRAVHAAQSLWWVPAAPVIQVAVFATNAMAIRSLVDRGSAGLDREGLFWFPDLTQPAMILAENSAPMGIAGAILPFAVLGVYLANISRAFGSVMDTTAASSAQVSNRQNLVIWLRPNIRLFLEWLCVGILWIGFQQPHALLVYVLSSASFSLLQRTARGQALTAKMFGESSTKPRNASLAAKPPNDYGLPAHMAEDGGLASTLFAEAAERRSQGDIEGAIEVLHRLVIIEPTESRAFFALGKLYGSREQWSASEASYLHSAELEEPGPQQARAYFGAGIAMYNQGEYDTAINAFQKAAEGLPGEAETWLALGGALAKDGKIHEAREVVEKAALLDPAVQEHLLPGLLLDLQAIEQASEDQASQGDQAETRHQKQ